MQSASFWTGAALLPLPIPRSRGRAGVPKTYERVGSVGPGCFETLTEMQDAARTLSTGAIGPRNAEEVGSKTFRRTKTGGKHAAQFCKKAFATCVHAGGSRQPPAAAAPTTPVSLAAPRRHRMKARTRAQNISRHPCSSGSSSSSMHVAAEGGGGHTQESRANTHRGRELFAHGLRLGLAVGVTLLSHCGGCECVCGEWGVGAGRRWRVTELGAIHLRCATRV
jgi:hypothetical protein